MAACPRKVTNPGAHWSKKPSMYPVHRQRILQATATTEDNRELRFLIYQRQSLQDGLSYSCGIVYLPPGGPRLTLARYNGPSHQHGEIRYKPHIHPGYGDSHPRRKEAGTCGRGNDALRDSRGRACVPDRRL